MVRYLAGLGLRQDDISAIIYCSEKTLRLYYRNELDEGLADATATIVAVLHNLIRAGNVAAQIFYDKCRGGKRQNRSATKKPNEGVCLLIDVPCEDINRCQGTLANMWDRHLVSLNKLSRQQAIASMHEEITRLKSRPKWFLEEQQKCVDRWNADYEQAREERASRGSNDGQR
jgi:hypothetical protein